MTTERLRELLGAVAAARVRYENSDPLTPSLAMMHRIADITDAEDELAEAAVEALPALLARLESAERVVEAAKCWQRDRNHYPVDAEAKLDQALAAHDKDSR